MLSRGPQGVEGRDTGRRQGGLTGFQEIGMICLGDECLVPPHTGTVEVKALFSQPLQYLPGPRFRV